MVPRKKSIKALPDHLVAIDTNTPGYSMILDRAVAEKHGYFIGWKFYYCRNGVNCSVIAVTPDEGHIYFARYLLKIKPHQFVDYKDGDRLNLSFDNIFPIERADINRKSKRSGYQFKGIRYSDGHWRTDVFLTANYRISLVLSSRLEAASAYNAILDFIGIPGYRNENVPVFTLTAEHRTLIQNKLDFFLSNDTIKRDSALGKLLSKIKPVPAARAIIARASKAPTVR